MTPSYSVRLTKSMADTLQSHFPHVNKSWKATLRRRILNWFDQHQRDLPWRRNPSLYRVWVSEIMLQQTQVATVIPYFQRFIKSFPSIRQLASAEESLVLRHWEGLGYYRRARQLHRAAKLIVNNHKGKFPTDYDKVMALPGIGRYSAGAILSIAIDARQPILEGNTVRLFSRLLGQHGDPTLKENNQKLWMFAEDILPRKRVGDLNQALMELGSEVCTPQSPGCFDCPVSVICPTNQEGLQQVIPASKVRPKTTKVRAIAVVIARRDKILVRQYEAGERWAGLWDFIRFESDDQQKHDQAAGILEKVKNLTGLTVNFEQQFLQLTHTVTRYKISLDCYRATCVAGSLKQNAANFRWIGDDELTELPLSVTGRKIANAINN